MEVEKTQDKPHSKDRMLVVLALLGLLLCSLPLASDRVYSFIFGQSRDGSTTPVIGEISFAKNDIRHKNSDSLTWDKAAHDQAIHLGDSVFTGDNSQSQVKLKDGGKVDIDQNSMVTFSKIKDMEVPNLAVGNFRVAVQGKMQIAINGEMTEIEGDGSEVQVVMKAHEKPKVRLLKGQAKVRASGGKSVSLVKNEMVAMTEKEVREPIRVPALAQPAEPVVAKPVVKAALKPAPAPNALVYTDQLYDYFEVKDGHLAARDTRRTFVKFDTGVSWSWSEGEKSPFVYGQLSSSGDFKLLGDSFKAAYPQSTGHFINAFLGNNFYRLSMDGRTWSQSSFFVRAQALDKAPPTLSLSSGNNKVYLLDDQPATLEVSPHGDLSLTHFVVEVSQGMSFVPASTQVYWTTDSVKLSLTEPQTLFMRVRGVNAFNQITAASPVMRVEIERPALPQAPRLAKDEYKIYEDEWLKLSWSTPAGKSTVMEVTDPEGRTLSGELKGHSKDFKHLKVGEYHVKLMTKDEYGRNSKSFARAEIHVMARELPPVAKVETKPTVQEQTQNLPELRKPSAVETTSMKMDDAGIPNYLNKRYSDSVLSVEGGGMTAYSQEQLNNGQPNPEALAVGVRVMNWYGRSGFEGSINTKLVNVQTGASGDTTSPLDLEARYHYRFPLAFSPFSGLGSSQLSTILGYEYYRNLGGGMFSPQYSLMKAGISLKFPLASRWDTGGELLYGLGFDTSQKYEASGFVDYYFKPEWSLGVGYRAYVFQAGSEASSPWGLPYREAMGEAYSVLRWFY